MAKFEFSGALVKRVALALAEALVESPNCFTKAVELLDKENVHNPERSVEKLILELADAGYENLAVRIGMDAAREAHNARHAIRDFRRAFGAFMDTSFTRAGDRPWDEEGD